MRVNLWSTAYAYQCDSVCVRVRVIPIALLCQSNKLNNNLNKDLCAAEARAEAEANPNHLKVN